MTAYTSCIGWKKKLPICLLYREFKIFKLVLHLTLLEKLIQSDLCVM